MPSRFLDEITQQPEELRRLIAFYAGDEGCERLRRWTVMARSAGRVHFTGMGTSAFAAETVLASLARHGVDATTDDAGELLHDPRPLTGLSVLVSQSGESVETRRLLDILDLSRGMVAITNAPESTIARAASLVLPLLAGDESAISTKTYVNTLAVLFLLDRTLAGDDIIALEALGRIADVMPVVDPGLLAHAAALIADTGAIQFIARGPAMAAARQAALTFMEGTHSNCTALTGGAFRHGPFELVGPDHRAVIYISGGPTADLLTTMATEIAAYGSHVVAITNRELDLPADTCAVLHVPQSPEVLFSLAAATTQELLLGAVARQRGIEAGVFRYGGKITTHE